MLYRYANRATLEVIFNFFDTNGEHLYIVFCLTSITAWGPIYVKNWSFYASWTASFFEIPGDGTISKQEFRHGCEVLNSKLPVGEQVTDPDALLHMMDIDGNDGIDLNEFFEVFRLVDALDGKMDGHFDILKGTWTRPIAHEGHTLYPSSRGRYMRGKF